LFTIAGNEKKKKRGGGGVSGPPVKKDRVVVKGKKEMKDTFKGGKKIYLGGRKSPREVEKNASPALPGKKKKKKSPAGREKKVRATNREKRERGYRYGRAIVIPSS